MSKQEEIEKLARMLGVRTTISVFIKGKEVKATARTIIRYLLMRSKATPASVLLEVNRFNEQDWE